MQFLTSLLGGGDNMLITGFLALVIVLVMIVIGMWLLKLLTGATSNVTRGRNRRLTIVEQLAIDPKRQLTIIRRDGVEHLLLTGGPTDLLVESGIPHLEHPIPARPVPVARRAAAPERPAPDYSDHPLRPGQPIIPPAAVAEPVAPAQKPQLSTMDRLRELGKTATGRGNGAPRHPGLLRPTSRMSRPELVTPAQNSTVSHDDSAKQAVESIEGGQADFDNPGTDIGPKQRADY